MTIVEKIIFDEEWNQMMRKIDSFSYDRSSEESFECFHGYSHAFAVVKYARDFLSQLCATEHEKMLCEVSALIHDIALTEGKSDHAKRGCEKAKKFLERITQDYKKMSKKDIELICHAIANHSNGDSITNNIDLGLFVADKMDVTRDRLAVVHNELTRELNKVHNVSIEITKNNLTLKYQADSDFDEKAIKHWPKMVTGPQKAADYLGLDFLFTINDEHVDLEFLK